MSSLKNVCGPCGYDQISKVAQKWCTVCKEGLCKDCVKMHKATKITRHHKLIGIDDFQNISAISIKHTCEEHGNTLGLYCKAHDSVLCIGCVPSKHKLCGDIIPLEDAAKYAKTSTALTDLEKNISIGLSNVQSIIRNTNLSHLDEQEENIQDEIREFRVQINNRLDEIEQDLILKLESTLAKYRSKYDTVLKHMKKSEKAMIHLKEQLTEMKTLTSDLHIFLGTRQINRTVYEYFKSTSEYKVTDKCNFNVEIDPVLNSLLTEVKTFGNINIEVTKSNIPLSQPGIGQEQTHVQPPIKSISQIGVTLKQRFAIKKTLQNTMITGCTILPSGQLIIADAYADKQLMEYNQDGTHVRDIPVSGNPFGVTAIDSEHVAVSYGGSRYIEILNIKNTEVLQKVFLGTNTYELSYQEGRLYVVVLGSGIKVVELSWQAVNTLNINFEAWYVTATSDRIYYSNYRSQGVTCCDMCGNKIWTFKDDSLGYPSGLTVDNNQNVFVLGSFSHNVTIISRDGKQSKTLLTSSDGLSYPHAIYLSKDTGDLLVCNKFDTRAALFKVKY